MALAVDENVKMSKEKLKTDINIAFEKLRQGGKKWKLVKPEYCYDRYVIDRLAEIGKIEIAKEEHEVEGVIRIRVC